MFHGWQRQSGLTSVQGVLEDGLSFLNGKHVDVIGAGRTDAGVHARGQVCSFGISRKWDSRELMLALNSKLPDGVTVMRLTQVRPDFHARYDAVSREYMYFIWNRNAIYPHLAPFTCWLKGGGYDWSLAAEACKYLKGEHDFRNFCHRGNKNGSTVRTLHSVRLQKSGSLIRLHLRGSGFLTNMVRIIVGNLELVAKKERDPEWINELFKAEYDRRDGGRTFPPAGLFLWKINYDPSPWD